MTDVDHMTEALRQGVNDEMADLWVATERLLLANQSLNVSYGWEGQVEAFKRRAERLANQLLSKDDLDDTVLDLAAALVVYRAALVNTPVPYQIKEG